ncbi:hypothetical protein Tco_0658031 [Tanacetum coccineum]
MNADFLDKWNRTESWRLKCLDEVTEVTELKHQEMRRGVEGRGDLRHRRVTMNNTEGIHADKLAWVSQQTNIRPERPENASTVAGDISSTSECIQVAVSQMISLLSLFVFHSTSLMTLSLHPWVYFFILSGFYGLDNPGSKLEGRFARRVPSPPPRSRAPGHNHNNADVRITVE